MANTNCPYEPTIRDEASGEVITNYHYAIWMQGYNACVKQYTEEVERITGKFKAEIERLRQPVNSKN